MGLREDAFARARSRGLKGWDAYDAAEDEGAEAPSAEPSISVEEFRQMAGAQTAPEIDSAEVGEPVPAPAPRPPPAPSPPPMPPPEMPRPPKAPPQAPQQSSADRLASAFEEQNRQTQRQGVSDALYAATAATPLQPGKTPELGAQAAAVDSARASDTSAGMKAGLSDPKSPASMRARALLEGTDIGRKMKERLGPRWDSLTAAALPEVGEIVRAEAAKREGAAPGQHGALTDYQRYQIQQNDTKKTEETAQLERDRENLGREFGLDLTGWSRAAIDDLMQNRHTQATEHMAQSNLALARSGEQRKQNDFQALGQPVPFMGRNLTWKGQGTPRDDDRRKVQEVAGLYNATFAGMDSLEQALVAFARNPSISAKREVESQVQVVSTAMNAALGQGAMSGDEKKAIADALGAQVLSPAGLQAVVQSSIGNPQAAEKILTSRLRAARGVAEKTALGKIRPYGFDFDSGSPAGPGAAGPAKTPRYVKDAQGNVYAVEE